MRKKWQFYRFNFSRGPSKYTRNWEDEKAYAKQNSAPPPRNPRPEDFPELGSKGERRRPSHRDEREEKENKSRPNYNDHDDRNDDNRNYSSRRRTSMRQISDRRDSDRRDSDRRDSDRRDSDRRDNDRRDNSKSLRQNDRYSSSKWLFNWLLKFHFEFNF